MTGCRLREFPWIKSSVFINKIIIYSTVLVLDIGLGHWSWALVLGIGLVHWLRVNTEFCELHQQVVLVYLRCTTLYVLESIIKVLEESGWNFFSWHLAVFGACGWNLTFMLLERFEIQYLERCLQRQNFTAFLKLSGNL